MKNSLRKSFSFRRRRNRTKQKDNEIPSRIDTHIGSNSNLVSNNPSASLLRRRRRHSSSPLPSPIELKPDVFEPRFEPGSDADDDDDETFSPSNNNRTRPFDRLTYRLRKSFQNTLIRPRSRIESTNSNKRLLINENRKIDLNIPISTGLTAVILPSSSLSLEQEIKIPPPPPRRRKAPLAPTHKLVSAQDLSSSFNVTNEKIPHHHEESGYSSLSDQHLNSDRNLSVNEISNNLLTTTSTTTTKKSKFSRSFRTRISFLLKKRHQKQQQISILPSSIDEDGDTEHHHDNHKIIVDQDIDELNCRKSATLGQRFDTLRRSLHLGSRTSNTKGKRRLLSNE